MSISLLLCWPSKAVVLAILLWALPRTLVCLDMLRQVTRALELLVTERTFVDLRLGILLASGHRAKDLIVIFVHGSRGGASSDVLWRQLLARQDNDGRRHD